MKELSERAAVAEVGQHVAVAKEILESSDGAQVVAYLLKSYFGQQANEASRRKPQRAESNTPDDGAETNNRRSRRRRGRRRRRRSDNNDNYQDSTPDGLMLANNGSEAASRAAGEGAEGTEAPADGLARLRVNIGFDDGFKGRGAVAKKIAALAGLNDGIVTEVESRREYAVLKATAEIAELVIERVDGAQLGKKVITVSMAS